MIKLYLNKYLKIFVGQNYVCSTNFSYTLGHFIIFFSFKHAFKKWCSFHNHANEPKEIDHRFKCNKKIQNTLYLSTLFSILLK